MTKEEFLDGLSKALASTGSESLIEENIRFYSSYIDDELSRGRSMDDIMEELGEPRLIANSIKVAAGYDDVFAGLNSEVSKDDDRYESTFERKYEDMYNDDESLKDEESLKSAFKVYNLSGKSLILPIIIILAVLILVVAVIATVFSFLAPILLPIIVVLILLGLIRGIIYNRR